MRAAAEALGATDEVEAGWLRGAAELVERGEPVRRAARAGAVWLEELAPEARARRTSLLSAWVASAEALRTAIHAQESERGPLVEALFPVWRAPALRRHADQALAAEAELRRRLASGYVVRRLAEPATAAALRPALEAVEAAAAAWAAERDRPALGGVEADEVRATLLAVAEQTTHTLERVRRVVRAALADRPDLVDEVFPRRGRATEAVAREALGEEAAAETATPEAAASSLSSPADTATTVPAPAHDANRRAGTRRTRSSVPKARPSTRPATPAQSGPAPRKGPAQRPAAPGARRSRPTPRS